MGNVLNIVYNSVKNPSLFRECYDDPENDCDDENKVLPNKTPLCPVSLEIQRMEQQRSRYAAALGKHGLEGLNAIELDYKLDNDNNSDMRLYHVPSGEYINEQNHKEYIAEGEMYEIVANLCQDFAQEILMQRGDLMWATLHTFDAKHHEKRKKRPIRALVSRKPQRNRGVLLILTGKGKVRGGIFSRRFLMTSGVRIGTCLNYVEEAMKRGMGIVILDPNVNSDREGMSTFRTSFQVLFSGETTKQTVPSTPVCGEESPKSIVATNANFVEEKKMEPGDDDSTVAATNACEFEITQHFQSCNLYALAHSASGGFLLRTLLDNNRDNDCNTHAGNGDGESDVCNYAYYSHKVLGVAFTDGTQNLNWCKENNNLRRFLEGPSSIYVKSSNVRTDDYWSERKAGEFVDTDGFWTHRFGNIKTIYAGTPEHSLINYTAEGCIWEHFDSVSSASQDGEQEKHVWIDWPSIDVKS